MVTEVTKETYNQKLDGIVLYGQKTSDGTLVPIKTDNDGNFIIQLEGATVNIGDVDVATSVPEGATTDTPFVGTEDNTARSIISILKGIKNTIYGTVIAGISNTCGFNNFVSAPITLTLSTAGVYAAGDCLGGALIEIPNIAIANGRGGIIDMIRVSLNEAAKTPRIRVHFFTQQVAASVPSIAADNALWIEMAADSPYRVGYLETMALASAPGAGVDCSRAQDVTNRQTLRYKCGASSTSLFVGFETLDAVTITAGKILFIVVKAEMS